MEKKSDDLLADAYKTLHLPPDASLEEARTACSVALLEAGKDDQGWERAKEIEHAFEIVGTHLSGRSHPAPRVIGTARMVMPQESKSPARALLFPAPKMISGIGYWPRVFFFLVLSVWGARFIAAPIESNYVGHSFMHLINLPFHEAGHILFSFFGDFLRVLGGTLAQVLVPLVCLVAFLRQTEPFGASCCLWWTGQSFVDAAPYIYDARAGQLILLGGITGQDNPDFHDWHNILARLGLLQYDHALAYMAKSVGSCLIVLSLAWAAWALFRQRRIMRSRVQGEL
jgi:hypothetical protein